MPGPEHRAIQEAVAAHKAVIARPPNPIEPMEEIQVIIAKLRREREAVERKRP